ncbi:MAG: tetratricopeptide repeat protein [Planctomycetota bacterium]
MELNKLYAQGNEAFERGNWGLAVMLWQQLLAMQPGHVDARKMLREAENRQWAQEGRGKAAKVLAYVQGLPAIVAFAYHFLTKNYDRAMIDCEKVLAYDPTCTPMLWGLAKAAMKGGHAEIAVLTLEYIREKNPTSTRVHRDLGYQYEAANEIAKAIESWENLKRVDPTNRESQLKLRDLAAMKTMVDGRYDTATEDGATYRKSLRSKEESEELEEEHRIIRTEEDLRRAIERVSKDVKENPENKRYILQLGDLHRRAKEYDEARQLYERARALDKMDFSIPERLGELRIDQYDEKEAELQAKLKQNPDDDELKSRLEALQQEKFEFSKQEFQRQIKARPTDSGLRVKLGDLLFNAGEYEEAAPQYQRAANDPRMRRRCRKLLGMCLYNTKKYQLAASQFEQAVEGGTPANREVREIMYYQAITLEQLGELDRAEEVLRKIFDADMSYKDVQERLDRLMEKKASGKETETQTGTEGAS